MVISGIYLGMARETYERFSRIWYRRKALTYGSEITFWLLQTIIIFFVLYKVNYGEIRIYTFLAILLGYSMYVVLFQTVYKRLLEIIIKTSKFIIRMTIRIVDMFIIVPIKWILKVILAILSVVLRLVTTILNVLFYPVRILLKKINIRLPNKIIKHFDKVREVYSTIKDKLKKS